MQKTSLLISGAGIAGSTLAALAARHGMNVTVVERATAQRSSGSPVDVRGAAYEVAERLGVIDRLHAHATSTTELVLVNSQGRPIARTSINSGRDPHHIELSRSALSTALADAGSLDYEAIYGDHIQGIRDHGGRVEVSFAHGTSRIFDLVIGADGTHSGVRNLAMTNEASAVKFLGLYVATVQHIAELENRAHVLMHNVPGASVTIHPATGMPTVAFIFRSKAHVDYHDRASQQRLLHQTYANMGWRAKELLAIYDNTEDGYFDAVTRVSLRTWSKGHIALVGDAATSLSLFGDGSSAAMIGAANLAYELATADRSDRDWADAFARYERSHRRRIAPYHRGFHLGSHFLVPATRLGIVTRNAALRLTGGRPATLAKGARPD